MKNKFLFAGAALTLGVLLVASQSSAKAYDFTGVLASPFGGDDTVSGYFTLNQTIYPTVWSVNHYKFTTPIGVYGPYKSVAVQYTAYSPNADFVQLRFFGIGPENFLTLVFETSLSSFSGDSFYTAQVQPRQYALTNSELACLGQPGCNVNYSSSFTSGQATAVPEPAIWTLMLFGLVGVGGLTRARRERQAETAV